ncbi:MAG: hypothetical protein IBX64_02250 [Actinobacteria bacterium]|nr:hypothetical protein [Actinomycetota bacterium]
MGLRAYLLIDVVDDVDQQQFIEIVRELEEMKGIEFVDPVTGSCDLVIMVETPLSVEALVNKIRAEQWLKKIEVLRIVSIFERRRALNKL